MRTLHLLVAVTVAAMLPGVVDAQQVRGAISVTSPNGNRADGTNGATNNIINQSGLSAAYTSGTTDFGSYAASTTSTGGTGVSGYTARSTNAPTFNFDLGANYTINGAATWSWNDVGNINRYQLYSYGDGQFTAGTGTLLGTFSGAENTVRTAVVADFAAVNARYFQLVGTDYSGPSATYLGGLGEIVFRQVAAAPEPSTWLLMIAGFGIVGGMLRRRRANVPPRLTLAAA